LIEVKNAGVIPLAANLLRSVYEMSDHGEYMHRHGWTVA
jgi:hypothetical protein